MRFNTSGGKQVKLTVLGDPPAPPPGSDFDFVINGTFYGSGTPISSGTPTYMLAQNVWNYRNPITQIACSVVKIAPAPTEPLIIGLVPGSIVGLDAFFDLNNWHVWGTLDQSVLPEFDTPYWIAMPTDLTNTEPLCLAVVTNQPGERWLISVIEDGCTYLNLYRYCQNSQECEGWINFSPLDMACAIYSPPTPCSDYNQTECEEHDCWWWNQACHDDQPTNCDQLNNQFDCERWGCYWWGGACHSEPQGQADGVITDMHANPNPVPYGGDSTVSLTGQNAGSISAYFALNIWRDTADWEYATLNPGESFTNTRLFSNITSNQMIWGYLWRWDTAIEDWILDDEADVLIQLEGSGPVTLEKCITLRDDTWNCDPYTSGSCNCGDEGPQQNTFDWQLPMMCYSKITGDIYGTRHMMVYFFDWGDGLYPVWSYEWDPTLWSGYACFWAWPNIGDQFGNGTGVVGIYIDGSYIGESNQFTITGAPQGAIIDWWRKDPRIGPFTPGQQNALVIGGEFTNTGDAGFYYFKLVQNPGTPQENLLALHGNDLGAGQGMGFGHSLDMPTVAGIYTLGFKIWGDDQSEPSWGSENTQIWDIYVGITPPCEEYWFQWECEDNGCYWYDDSCHSALPCSSYSTQSTCEAAGCYWWNGSCHDLSPSCEELNNQSDCETYGCYWWGGICHSDPITCEDYTTQQECEQHGCYWYNNSCHTSDIVGEIISNFSPYPPTDFPPGEQLWLTVTIQNPSDVTQYYSLTMACTNTGFYESIMFGVAAGGEQVFGPLLIGNMYGEEVITIDLRDQIYDIQLDYEEHIVTINCETGNPTQQECEQAGCYWYDNSCHSQPICEDYLNQTECEAAGCYWWGGSCHTLECIPATVENGRYDVDNDGVISWMDAYEIWLHRSTEFPYDMKYDMNCDGQVNFQDAGLCWVNRDPSQTCEDVTIQEACELFGCYWYDDSCHSEPPPDDLCAWIIAQLPGWPSQPVTDIPITSVTELIDSFVSQTPPTGYTFIPTLQNVFGVIDYYLGFDGDPGTGCDLFP